VVRHGCKLSTFDDTVRRNFQNWVMKHHSGGTEKFNEEQMDWLRMIRDHVARLVPHRTRRSGNVAI